MHFIIKQPDNDSLNMLLETRQYQELWKQHARRLRRAFRQVMGLDFQQYTITARVYPGNLSMAGNNTHPMKLAGDNRSVEFKLCTMVHELSHRLLAGNGLGVVWLGLGDVDQPESSEEEEVAEHYHIYLFSYDVIRQALGKDWAKAYCRYEERFDDSNDSNYTHLPAWRWAMSLSYSQRQKALKFLTAKALPRNRWHEMDEQAIKRIDIQVWLEQLDKVARAD